MSDDIAHGQWNQVDARRSSAWRELKAVEMVMASFVKKLGNHVVKWFTDNQSVAAIATKGSMKTDLQEIALNIFRICVQDNISLEVEWVPRSDNERADYISRIIDADDWAISDYIFEKLDTRWGPHTIDRFASFYNAKLPRFDSRFWNPGCENIDAFTVDWSNENNWLVPPIHLIPRVLFHMMRPGAAGTLICPQWYSAPFGDIVPRWTDSYSWSGGYTGITVIFQSGIWSDAGYEEHDERNKLASELPGVTLNSRADSTIKQYGGAFCNWCTWADRFGKSKIPADPYYVSLYLIHVSHSANTPAPILKATAAISWAHKLAGSSDPCLSPIVKNAAEGLKRKLASPTVKKEPITAEILVKVYDHYCADLSIKNLLTIRTVTMCLIAYAGFLRFDELSEIKREDITFELSHMSILIPSSKTDIYRQGNSVIIARLTSTVCPVRMLQKYLELAQVQD
ncbi:uncharacterized protein [Amphiura filiformis]|uniref:uncharacterized protein n=1 Tax=Amphiura filiformis TaxID=82378 RepID=UPI003B223329